MSAVSATARLGRDGGRAVVRAGAATRWELPSLIGLLGVTALLYLWNLGAEGWANSFYSAAVQAGTRSWTAFFFGSFDASNFITVDKSPAALWVMELSARVFGLSSWSVLVPQALEGVGTVALVYFAVRRWFGHGAGLLAGGVVALTPVAALMFRFNNPDAFLTLLLTGATYATLLAIETGRARWLVLMATLVGFAFLAKMLQAFIVVPVLFGAYAFFGRPALWVRARHLMVSAVALAAAAGWWVAIVELVPASLRPYVGGSQDNSILSLVLGYNGFGRLTGNETGSVGGGQTGSMWGPPGWNRLFNDSFGGQASWLIPAALVLLAGGLWFTRGRPRHDLARASLLVWGGTLLLTGAVFSFAQGIIHPYYTVALAPAIGALVGVGAAVLWRRRAALLPRLLLAAAILAAAAWSGVLLGRTPGWLPWLAPLVAIAGAVAAAGIVAGRRLISAAAAVGVAAALAGPAAYTLSTVASAHAGAIPAAGPAVAAGLGSPGGPGGGPGAGRIAFGGPPPGAGLGFGPGGQPGPPPAFARGGLGAGPAAGGGFLESSRPGAAVIAALQSDAQRYSWVAATVDANNAAGYQLATGDPVMAIGGFNGTDPAPTLEQFQQYVAQGRIHYFIAGGGGGPARAAGAAADQITAWVESHFAPRTVGGATIYDLTSATI